MPFRFDPVPIEPVWQVAFVALALLAGVRLVLVGWAGARRRAWRVWLAAAGTLLGAFVLTRTLHRASPDGWQVLFLLLAGAGVYVLSVLTYRLSTRPIAPRERRLLMGLRAAAVIAAALLLLRPVFVKRSETREKADLFFLYDTSRSMVIRDGTDGASRMTDLLALRAAYESQRNRLGRKFQVSEYEVRDECLPVKVLTKEPTGPATAIGPALQHLADRTGHRQVAAVVLLSDGAHNTGADPAQATPFFRARQVPIYTVGFGKDILAGQVRDVAVKAVRSNATVFTRNVFPVEADLACLGVRGETVRVELLLDGKPVDQKDLTVGAEALTERVTLSCAPGEVGIHKITVRAAAVSDELVPDNNEASTYVNVLSGGLGVLYVEGQARWEYKFLRRTLEASPDFQVTPLLVLAPMGEQGAGRLPPGVFDWTRYEVVILGDVRPDVFSAEQLEGLKTAVGDQGKGLMMIGGYDSFGPGGWGRTPLADALPVKVDPGDPQLKGLFRLTPGRAAARHFVLQIEEDAAAGAAAWDRLPPLDGATAFAGVKPAGEVLATGLEGRPLLVVQDYGKGRAIAFGADSTWRWAFSAEDLSKYHKRFWRQVVLWLARRDKAQGEQMWLALDRQRVTVGDAVEVTAYVQDAVGRAIPGCDVRADLVAPDGTRRPVTFNFQTDAYRVSVKPATAGDYTIHARAVRDGREVGTAEARFVVYVPDLELERPVADLALLRAVAAQTGGAFFTPADARRLFEVLDRREVRDTVKVETDIVYLWDQWWALAAFVAALTAEWVLRRRRGMI